MQTLQERTNVVTMKGNPVTLLGKDVAVSQEAPDATLVANDLSEVKLSSFRGKTCIVSVVPSLDTPVCDLQTKRFNKEAAALGDNVKILTISMDLLRAKAVGAGRRAATRCRPFPITVTPPSARRSAFW